METILLVLLTLRDGSKTFLELPTESKQECLFVDSLIRKDGFVVTESNKLYFTSIETKCAPEKELQNIGN